MTAHTPEELHEIGQRAIARLDAWLRDIGKLESPIDGALDDLYGFLEELRCVVEVECSHARSKCWDCVQNNVHATRESYERLYKLWEARA